VNPRELEVLLERNFEVNKADLLAFVISIFRGAHGYVAARAKISQRDGLHRFDWSLGISVDRAEGHLKDGKHDPETKRRLVIADLREALHVAVEGTRYLAMYTPQHAEELWSILRVGLTAKLPLVDSIAALDESS